MSENDAPKVKLSSRDRLKKLQEEESRMVTGVFRFHECPGGSVGPIPMKKYKGDMLHMTFKDGETYTIPLWAARWLNGYDVCASQIGGKINAGAYPVHQHAIDKNTGLPLVNVGQYRRRMSFESTEFMAV